MSVAKRAGLLAFAFVMFPSCGTVVTTVFDKPLENDGSGAAEEVKPGPSDQTGDPAAEVIVSPNQGRTHSDEADATQPADAGALDLGLQVGILASGSQGSIRVPLRVALTDRGAFLDAWAAVHANMSEPPATPVVDFDEQIVIVVGLGDRRTAGHSVGVASAKVRGGSLQVVIETTSPEDGEIVAAVVTSPYAIVSIPAAGLPVVFAGDDVEEGYDPDW